MEILVVETFQVFFRSLKGCLINHGIHNDKGIQILLQFRLRVRDVEESELALLAVQHDENGLLAGYVSLPVVRVYTFAGHKLADQGGFPDTPRPEYRHRVRGDLFRGNRILFLAFGIRGCERVRS